MPKPKKNNLGVRVDDTLNEEIATYAQQTDRTVAQLFRLAIREYMWAHPVTKLSQKVAQHQEAA